MAEVPVLCFHKITSDHEWGVTTYSPAWFEEILFLLNKNGYQFCLPHDTKQFDNPVIITFDDGYASVFENALPVLKKYNSPFIVFPIINYIGRMNDWDANIFGQKFMHLSEKELESCLESGGIIGSHGLTHKAFSLLNSSGRAEEIEKSFAYLKHKFNISHRYFAAPFGESAMSDLLLSKIDYSFLLNCKKWDGVNKLISRIPVYRFESPKLIIRKIQDPGRYRWLSQFVHFGAKATVLMQRLQG